MAFQAGAIVSQLTLDRSKFSAGIKAVQKQTKSLGGWVKKNSAQFKAMGLAAAAAGGAALVVFKKMVGQFVETGDAIHKMSLRTGISATALSELSHAADISGASLADVEKGVKRMARTITDAATGLESYVRPLKRIGLEAEKLQRLSPEEQFITISEAIAELEDPTLRAATAQEIFGRAGTMLLPLMADGAEGLRKLREEAHTLGKVFDAEAAQAAADLADAQTRLKAATQGLSIAVLKDLIPVITNVVDVFTEWFVNSRKDAATWAKAIIKFFKFIAQGIEGLMLAFNTLQLLVFKMGEAAARLMRQYIEQLIMGFGVLAKVGVPVKGILNKLIKGWIDMRTIEKGYWAEGEKKIETITNIVAGFENFFAALDKVAAGLDKVKKGEGEVVKAAEETVGALRIPPLGPLAVDIPKMSLKDFQKFYEEWLRNLNEKWRQQWESMMEWTQFFIGELGGIFGMFYDNQLMRIDQQFEAERARIEGSTMSQEQKAKAMEALETKIEKKRRAALRSQAKAEKVVSLLAAIVNTARAITKALPNIPLSIAVGAIGAAQIALIAAQPLPALQRGGRIEEAGIVGEKGPELFLPERPGMIVPLRERRGPLAAPGGVMLQFSPVFYLSTLDPQTAREVVRRDIAPELLEMLRTKIMLPEFQEALGTR